MLVGGGLDGFTHHVNRPVLLLHSSLQQVKLSSVFSFVPQLIPLDLSLSTAQCNDPKINYINACIRPLNKSFFFNINTILIILIS